MCWCTGKLTLEKIVLGLTIAAVAIVGSHPAHLNKVKTVKPNGGLDPSPAKLMYVVNFRCCEYSRFCAKPLRDTSQNSHPREGGS